MKKRLFGLSVLGVLLLSHPMQQVSAAPQLQQHGTQWLYVDNGIVQQQFTGLVQHQFNKQWFYVKNGQIDWSFTGLVQHQTNGGWFYVQSGMIDWNFTGLVQHPINKSWFYVQKGQINWNFTGLVQHQDNKLWYSVRSGMIDWNFTGLMQHQDNKNWYYVRSGMIDWNHTGGVQHQDNKNWYYVRSGMIDWSFNGSAVGSDNVRRQYTYGQYLPFSGIKTVNGGTFFFVNDEIDRTKLGHVFYNNSWYSVVAGKATRTNELPPASLSIPEGYTIYDVDLGNGKKDRIYYKVDEAASNELLALINQYRAQNGRHALSKNESLATLVRGIEAAYLVAVEGKLTHDRPNGLDAFSVYKNNTYAVTGSTMILENLTTYRGAQGAFNSWKTSPGHNQNMLTSAKYVTSHNAIIVTIRTLDGRTRTVAVQVGYSD